MLHSVDKPIRKPHSWSRHFEWVFIFFIIVTFGQLLPYHLIVLCMTVFCVWFLYGDVRNLMFRLIAIGTVILAVSTVMVGLMAVMANTLTPLG